MSEMVGRVATILEPELFSGAWTGHGEGECEDCDNRRTNARAKARAAIAAIREPTPLMLGAVPYFDHRETTDTEIWQAMIDEALR